MTRRLLTGLVASAMLAFAFSTVVQTAVVAPVADAAMTGDVDGVRALLKDGADVNAPQGDGMTALHWAAMRDDKALSEMLIYAGANVHATTRLGAYTPLLLACDNGAATVVEPLLAAGSNPNAVTSNGTTPLMLAASAGDAAAVKALLAAKADVDARDTANEETPLMFAAAAGRLDVVELLADAGAKLDLTAKVVDLKGLTAPEDRILQQAGAAPDPKEDKEADVPGLTRPWVYTELIGAQGGLTALHFAARQGHTDVVKALLARGADINQLSPADHMSPLLIATINGHFDLAMYMLEHGADPTIAADNGVTPLYGALNVEWAPKSFYPQPRAYLQQETTYLQLMEKLLEKGADPNARVNRKVWYMQYNFDLLRIDESGATPFWRAAYASDIEAMKLLVAHGADYTIPTMKPAGRTRRGASAQREEADKSGLAPVPVGGPGIPPLQAAAGVGYGEGFAGNAHRFAPTGMLAAVKYLVEDLHVDVNQVDHEGNTVIHQAAARGDNEMIEYLVAHGADVTKVNRDGQTTVDMANGPVQRVQPFPETIALLEKLGAKNNHNCVSC
ncbi:MAG: ankyrin repeat domain-containing protein [Vicinamibacterales bacterium]